jgi:hypothetical protein
MRNTERHGEYSETKTTPTTKKTTRDRDVEKVFLFFVVVAASLRICTTRHRCCDYQTKRGQHTSHNSAAEECFLSDRVEEEE